LAYSLGLPEGTFLKNFGGRGKQQKKSPKKVKTGNPLFVVLVHFLGFFPQTPPELFLSFFCTT